MKILWVITAVSSLLGMLVFLISTAMSGGLAQAAGFAASSALAVVPYVFTKCLQAVFEPSAKENARLVADAIKGQKLN
jgi:hypothetical protein